jgi:hypothetical protein
MTLRGGYPEEGYRGSVPVFWNIFISQRERVASHLHVSEHDVNLLMEALGELVKRPALRITRRSAEPVRKTAQAGHLHVVLQNIIRR